MDIALSPRTDSAPCELSPLYAARAGRETLVTAASAGTSRLGLHQPVGFDTTG